MHSLRGIALTLGLLSIAAPASAQVTVAEGPDFSNSPPGSAIALGVGTNTISGSVTTPGDPQDNFQVTVPTGGQLTAANLTLNTGGGFVGGAIFNLSDVRNSSGPFTMGFPYGPGTYSVFIYGDFAIGNAWSISFSVVGAAPVCGNGLREGSEACDDGNTTQCDGCSATCTVALNGCFIGGTCIADGTLEPSNACRACRRTVSRTAYSPVASGTTCNDGLFCTAVDTCNGLGTCTGTPRTCSDSLSCTADACDETANICVNPVTSGCLIGGACVAEGTIAPGNVCLACRAATSTSTYSPRPNGTSCDDGQFCTTTDACSAGTCTGAARDCNDPLSCTTDACDEAADMCTHALAGGCLIDGECVAEGTVDPGNTCLACVAASSTSAFSAVAEGTTCDDGSFCTIDDACDGSGACGGAPRSCADDDACTSDACDAAAGECTFTPIPDCSMADAGMETDGGVDVDGGTEVDGGGIEVDGGTMTDAGSRDAAVADGGGVTDGGGLVDGGDAGTMSGVAGGCGCRAAGPARSSLSLLGLGALALVLAGRRRR